MVCWLMLGELTWQGGGEFQAGKDNVDLFGEEGRDS